MACVCSVNIYISFLNISKADENFSWDTSDYCLKQIWPVPIIRAWLRIYSHDTILSMVKNILQPVYRISYSSVSWF